MVCTKYISVNTLFIGDNKYKNIVWYGDVNIIVYILFLCIIIIIIIIIVT
jgi:hypothetical protein